MEIGVAYGLLCRVLQAARARDVKDVVDFRKRLEWYVRSEVGHFRELQDAVYGEIQQWNREMSELGNPIPRPSYFRVARSHLNSDSESSTKRLRR